MPARVSYHRLAVIMVFTLCLATPARAAGRDPAAEALQVAAASLRADAAAVAADLDALADRFVALPEEQLTVSAAAMDELVEELVIVAREQAAEYIEQASGDEVSNEERDALRAAAKLYGRLASYAEDRRAADASAEEVLRGSLDAFAMPEDLVEVVAEQVERELPDDADAAPSAASAQMKLAAAAAEWIDAGREVERVFGLLVDELERLAASEQAAPARLQRGVTSPVCAIPT
jgi:hypothetical protein